MPCSRLRYSRWDCLYLQVTDLNFGHTATFIFIFVKGFGKEGWSQKLLPLLAGIPFNMFMYVKNILIEQQMKIGTLFYTINIQWLITQQKIHCKSLWQICNLKCLWWWLSVMELLTMKNPNLPTYIKLANISISCHFYIWLSCKGSSSLCNHVCWFVALLCTQLFLRWNTFSLKIWDLHVTWMWLRQKGSVLNKIKNTMYRWLFY